MLRVVQASGVTYVLGLTYAHNECMIHSFPPASWQHASGVGMVTTLQMQQLRSGKFRGSLDKSHVSRVTSVWLSLSFLMC